MAPAQGWHAHIEKCKQYRMMRDVTWTFSKLTTASCAQTSKREWCWAAKRVWNFLRTGWNSRGALLFRSESTLNCMDSKTLATSVGAEECGHGVQRIWYVVSLQLSFGFAFLDDGAQPTPRRTRARTTSTSGCWTSEKGEVLLRVVGTLRFLFQPNASAQWQLDSLTIHARKWLLGAGFLGAPPISLSTRPPRVVANYT